VSVIEEIEDLIRARDWWRQLAQQRGRELEEVRATFGAFFPQSSVMPVVWESHDVTQGRMDCVSFKSPVVRMCLPRATLEAARFPSDILYRHTKSAAELFTRGVLDAVIDGARKASE